MPPTLSILAQFMFGGMGASSPFGGAATAKNSNTNNSTEVPSGPSDTVSCLAWSASGNLLAGASWDKQVRIWEVQPSMGATSCTATARVAYSHDAPVLGCAFTADNSTLFSAGCDNKIKAYNLQAQRDQVIGQHDMPISAIHWIEELKMVVTAGWDRTVRFWNGTSPTPVLTLQLPERCYSMDVKYPLLVCACAEKHIVVYNLQTIQHNTNPFKTIQSALRLQSRVVCCFPDKSGFAIGSIEGRVSVAYLDDSKKDDTFAFKCHRTNDEIFPVNAIDFHPFYNHSFLTAGGDGTISIWDKSARQKLKAFNNCNYPITAAKFNATGDLMAYAVGYDWSKGFEHNQASIPKKIFVHRIQEIEIKPKANPGSSLNSFPKRR